MNNFQKDFNQQTQTTFEHGYQNLFQANWNPVVHDKLAKDLYSVNLLETNLAKKSRT